MLAALGAAWVLAFSRTGSRCLRTRFRTYSATAICLRTKAAYAGTACRRIGLAASRPSFPLSLALANLLMRLRYRRGTLQGHCPRRNRLRGRPSIAPAPNPQSLVAMGGCVVTCGAPLINLTAHILSDTLPYPLRSQQTDTIGHALPQSQLAVQRSCSCFADRCRRCRRSYMASTGRRRPYSRGYSAPRWGRGSCARRSGSRVDYGETRGQSGGRPRRSRRPCTPVGG